MNFSPLKQLIFPALVSGLMVACGGLDNENDTVQMENKKVTKKSGNESFKSNRNRNLRLSTDQKAKEAKKTVTETSGSEAETPEKSDPNELREYAIGICTERAAELLYDSLTSAPAEPEIAELPHEKSITKAYALVDKLTDADEIFKKLDAAYTRALDNMKGTDKKSVADCVKIIVDAETQAEKDMLAADQVAKIDKQWEKHEVVLNEILDGVDKVLESCEFFFDEDIEEELVEEFGDEEEGFDPEDFEIEEIEEYIVDEGFLSDEEFEALEKERRALADSKECKDATSALDAIVKKHANVKP